MAGAAATTLSVYVMLCLCLGESWMRESSLYQRDVYGLRPGSGQGNLTA